MSRLATRVEADITRLGRAMTLRRRSGTTNTFTDVEVTGVPRAYKPGELLGGITQGDQRVTISNGEIAAADWPGPPRKGDVIVIDGHTWSLLGAEPRYLGSAVVAHVLWVRGG